MPDDATIVACPSCGKKNRVRSTPAGVPRCSVCQTMLPWVVEASEASFDSELDASVPVLVDFWAPWCGPCRAVSPLVERLAREHAGNLKVLKLNVDNAPTLSQRYGIRGIPLLALFGNGQELDRFTGAAPYPTLESWLEQGVARAA
jgi:thioredoxin 2